MELPPNGYQIHDHAYRPAAIVAGHVFMRGDHPVIWVRCVPNPGALQNNFTRAYVIFL